ncbi:ROK family transcriptional regulator [Bifidobacterium sp. DSM 109957]|uniref:ROK family transcriptional regulator n=1 Tax=Bifidobacterium oedipodis TaxID=2675322 RepID=A0A7Y0HSM4_9BIFI|nr:ROK family transcriptional regulator [Bifidobacterium sp. DSM 109957]
MSLNDRFMSYSVINLLKVVHGRTAEKTTHASMQYADDKGVIMNTAQFPSSSPPSATTVPIAEEPPELRDLAIPCQRARAEHAAGNSLPSQVALLVASHTAQSKAALARETGLPRSTVSACVDTLVRRGLLAPTGTIAVDRGRPAERLAINEKLGLLALADVGARHTMLAVADMNMRLLACERHIIDVSAFSPGEFLDWLSEQLWRLAGKTRPDLPMRHAVLGLPARLDMRDGSPIRPPIMPGWDAFDTVGYLGEALGCPVMVENDTNLRALGDAATMPASEQPLIEVKIGTGIGGGIIGSDGRIFHGFNGAAGEVGHTCFDPRIRRRCACGQTGCLEAVAAVPAMLRRLQELSPRRRDTHHGRTVDRTAARRQPRRGADGRGGRGGDRYHDRHLMQRAQPASRHCRRHDRRGQRRAAHGDSHYRLPQGAPVDHAQPDHWPQPSWPVQRFGRRAGARHRPRAIGRTSV